MSLRISILFNIGLTQLVLISTCKAEGGISPHAKFDESRLSPKILTNSNIVNTNTSFTDKEIDLENIFSKENTPPLKDSDKSNSSSEILASSNNTNASFTDEEFDLENIQPLKDSDKSNSSSEILTSSNIINTNASFPNRKTDSENIPPFKGFSKSKSSSGILTSSNIVNTNASFLNRKTDSKHILSKENTPPLKDSDKSNSSSEILASSNIINTNASFTDKEIDLENIQPLTGLGKSKSSSEILTSSNIINTNASFPNRKTDSENIPPFKGFSKSKSSSGILTSSNIVNTNASFLNRKTDSKHILSKENTPPLKDSDKSNSSSEILASSNIINTNASFTNKEIDLENILSKENTPPLTGFGISNRNQSRYFAFGADENRSPSLLTQESKESTPELPTIARRKVYRVRLPSQKGNQSLEEKKQMEIIAQNPNTMVSESSKEDVLGTVTATSSTEVKQWDATSPLPSHQSSGTNLGGSPTTNLAKYATSTPTEVPANLVLSPSNNSKSDTFRDYRDGRDPVLKSPIKDITSTSNKQNNPSNISRELKPLFDNNGLKNTDLLSTDNQLQKIQPCEDEEQGLISEFKNLSITDFPDLEASSSGATQLTLPTTATMSNTTNHRNKLKKLKQRHKDNEFKQAMKKQEQRKKEEAKITADKKQLLDMVKQMNKERRQQARAEQNNRAIEQQSVVPKSISQEPLAPEGNKIPDYTFAQNNMKSSTVLDGNEGEWQEVVNKRQKRLNKKNIAKSLEVHTELVVKQNNGIIDQQSIVPKTFTQQPLTLETNKIPDYAFAQDKIEQSIVSDENGGEWQEVVSKRQKRLNKKNIAKSVEVQPEPPAVKPKPPEMQPEPPAMKPKPPEMQPEPLQMQPAPLAMQPKPPEMQPEPLVVQPAPLEMQPAPLEMQPEPLVVQPAPLAMQPKPPKTNLDLEGEEDYGLTVLFNDEESATSQTLSPVSVPTSTSTSTLSGATRSSKLRTSSLANSSSTQSNSTLENSDSNLDSELNNNKDSDQNSELKEKEEQKPNSKSELDNNQDSKSETPSSPVLKPNISADNDIASRNNSDALILQEQVKALEQQTVEVQKQVTSATINSVASVFDFIEQSVQSRFHQLDLAALASGDEDNIVSKNVWVSGTIGVAKYEGGNILSRYTGRTRAATIGGDIELQGGSIIGGAYNYVISNFKYKNRTDKVAAHAHVISIYGQTNLSDKLILQGVFSFALGNVSAKIPVQNQIAKAKFDNTSYSSKIVVAHKSQFGKVLITPNIGLKYGGYNIAGYNERFEAQSLSVAATNDRRASGIIGFEAVIPIKISDTTQVIPGLHMEGEKFLHNRQQKVRMQIASGSNKREEVLLLEKPAKYNYKVGGTITIKRGVTEIMAVYDYLASNNKYSSHQGSIKLRVSF
ncbi:autotransporter domain-containing protein [Candidatus Tisiphia endosymbiont of Mystacides longicornis]|uniref:autotransporter outer membrane beta-barrel domain-containing protein n=1 Tax=Candidatus Tisiphia endosymbiont of Mystacides longicornis TaxID=3139330 RepID=UPI003CCA8726